MNKLPTPEYLNLEYWFNRFFEFLASLPEKLLAFLDWLARFHLKTVSIVVSIVLAFAIIFVVCKIIRLRKKKIVSYLDFFTEEELPETRLKRWNEIKRHLDGDNPIEWKMAIIEADSLIDDIMKRIGYKGETLAERLKTIEPSDFENLQNIWEAHKIRNRIVHEPGKMELDRSTAQAAIEKYEKALRELKYL